MTPFREIADMLEDSLRSSNLDTPLEELRYNMLVKAKEIIYEVVMSMEDEELAKQVEQEREEEEANEVRMTAKEEREHYADYSDQGD